MFWARYVELCASNSKTPHKVAIELGITSGSVTGWKNGGIPRETTLKKIADYFGVTVEYLKGETDIKNPAAGDDSGMEKELLRLFGMVSDERKGEVMNYIKFLVSQNEDKKEL